MSDGASGEVGRAPEGLQAERTDLSWERCALSLLINGCLLLIAPGLSIPDGLQLAAAAIAFVLVAFSLAVARRRRRVLRRPWLPVPLADPAPVASLACGTVLLGLVVLSVLLMV